MTEAPVPPEAAAPSSPPPRRRRGLWVALIASLGVNIFLVGWMASSWVYGHRFTPGARSAQSSMHFRHWRAQRRVSGEDRETVRRIWLDDLPELRGRIGSLRQAHMSMRAAFIAETTDAQSMGAAAAAYKAQAVRVFDQLEATLLRIATTLPPDARRAYFDAGFAPHRERRRRRQRGDR